MVIHVVNARDSLWQIANYYRVSVKEIMDVNGMKNPNQLVIGQALVIPIEDNFYTVKYGDTFWEISKRYNVTLQDLLSVNNIENANEIYPGMVLTIPRKIRPTISVNGYIYLLGEESGPIVEKASKYLTYLSPFAYLIKEDGTLQTITDIPVIKVAKTKKVIPLMSITNFSSTALGANLAHIVLSNPQIIERLLSNIITIMKEKGYLGLNVDFENVLPADRELYNSFLQRTVDRLHPEGFSVSTALAPKASGAQTGTLYEAHDYAAHGKIVDFVVFMTYEWRWRKGPPQSISPLNEIIRVLNYAVTVIPRDKIFFGFQIYARDWLIPHVAGQEAETFSPQEAMRRAVKYGTIIKYDKTTQSPFFQYKDSQGRLHEVWFEDARSAQAKFDTVKSYKLKGISYWALGYPFPQNWALLEDNFIITK